MKALNKKIGQTIRDNREINQMTQLDLSRKLGYQSTQFVSLFERGLSKCPDKVLGKISKILEIDPKYFMDLILEDFKSDLVKDLGIK